MSTIFGNEMADLYDVANIERERERARQEREAETERSRI